MADPRTLASLVMARAEAAPDFLAYDKRPVETPTKGYVVHYFSLGAPTVENMSGRQSGLRWSYMAVCVGFTVDQCLFVASRYRARFLNWRPTTDRGDGWLVEQPDGARPVTPPDVEGDSRTSITLRFTLNTRST